MVKNKTKIEKLEALLAEERTKLEEARAQVVELKDEKENAIDRYMETKDFKNLMVAHDALIYPDYFEHGWDAVVKAVSEAHPGVVISENFPCPQATMPAGIYKEDDANVEDDRIIDLGESPEKSPMAEGVDGHRGPDEEGVRKGKAVILAQAPILQAVKGQQHRRHFQL